MILLRNKYLLFGCENAKAYLYQTGALSIWSGIFLFHFPHTKDNLYFIGMWEN